MENPLGNNSSTTMVYLTIFFSQSFLEVSGSIPYVGFLYPYVVIMTSLKLSNFGSLYVLLLTPLFCPTGFHFLER